MNTKMLLADALSGVRGRKVAAAAVVVGALLAAATTVWGICTDPPGDINGTGFVDVVDVQCALITNTWVATGEVGLPPACLGGEDPFLLGDYNCDGAVNVVDTTIFISAALGAQLSPAIDADANLCPDACEIAEPTASDCCGDTGVGCGDDACIECMCAVDPFCCDTQWDEVCGAEAQGQCGGGAVFMGEIALSGDQQVPPVASPYSGAAQVWLLADDSLSVTIEHDIPNATAGHIHMAPAGASGGVVVPFPNVVDLPIMEEFSLDAAQIASALAGDFYINIHTPEHPSGEIRGQIILQPATGCACAGAADGCTETDAPGATDAACQQCVCDGDVFCCEASWDELCVDEATDECATDCACAAAFQPTAAECCDEDGLDGCAEGPCTNCVCFLDPFCCDGSWDSVCAEQANSECGGTWFTGTFPLAGDQENPPAITSAMGTGMAWLIDGTTLVIHVEHDVAAATAAHIHMGMTGTNGGVVFPFDSPASPMDGTFTLSSTQADALLAGNWYVNVHSPAFPGGEIRGQIALTDAGAACECAGGGDGCTATEAPGSTNEDCQDCVCGADPFCCDTSWDVECVSVAGADCPLECGCPADPTQGDCCTITDAAGCLDSICEDCVCAEDDFCCLTAFDLTCAQIATGTCAGDCECSGAGPDPTAADCCHSGVGCGQLDCTNCVCNLDPFCCDVEWDENCAAEALNECGGDTYLTTISLDSGQEVPPTASAASGTATIQVTADGVLHWHVEHDVTGATAAHFHMAAAGSNGGVQIPLASATSPMDGDASLTAAQMDALLAGMFYLNIHSAAFPGGEIRGQVLFAGPLEPCLCADAGDGCEPTEAPGATNGVCAACVCGLDDFCCAASWDSLCVDQATVDCGTECGCELAEGEECCDPFAADCQDEPCVNCVCGLDPVCCELGWDSICADLATFDCGGDLFFAEILLDGLQEVPANASPASGAGYIYADLDSGAYTLFVLHDVLGATAAHIHMAPAGTNGGVQIPLTPGSPIEMQGNMSAAQISALLSGTLYVNIHSVTFPGGEIRGQIVGDIEQPCACGIGDVNIPM